MKLKSLLYSNELAGPNSLRPGSTASFQEYFDAEHQAGKAWLEIKVFGLSQLGIKPKFTF